MFTLRPRQVEASDCGYYSLIKGKKNEILYCSCAFGKSLVIADIAFRLGEPTLVLQPSVEILNQNYAKMLTYGVDGVTLYSASANSKEHGQIVFATIQSVYKKPEDFKHYKYLIIDECQDVPVASMETMFGNFFLGLGDPARIFLTGTPYRTVNKYVYENEMINGELEKVKYYTATIAPLNRIFNKSSKGTKTTAGKGANFMFGRIAFKAEMQEQIDLGYICKPEYDLSYSKAFDYSNLKMNTTGADFDADALERFVNEKDRLKQVVQACVDYDSKVKSNLIFCSSLGQAEACMNYCLKLGLSAAMVTGAMTAKARKQMLEDFKSGKVKHVFAFKVWGVGFDFPGLECLTFARPTVSVNTWIQYASRVIRKDPDNPDKRAIIVDVAGVSKRLGRIETIRLDKEDGYKDIVVSEVGVLSGKALSKFRMKKTESIEG